MLLKSPHTEFGQGYYIGARARFALRYFVRLLRTHPVYAVGYVIVAVMTIFAPAAPLIAPYSPITADPLAYPLPPSFSHLLGTDVPGMDVLSRAIFAPRADPAQHEVLARRPAERQKTRVSGAIRFQSGTSS
jgi:hypothetical protein